MPYLDHAATTPVLPEVADVVAAQLRSTGNPSSLHASGRAARRVIEEARETIAAALGALPTEVVFTSGGTEADNLAVKGIYWSRRAADPRRSRVLASSIEHHAVMDSVEWLGKHEYAEVEWLPVDHTGRVDLAALRHTVEADPSSVALITVMWANNEVGTLQSIRDIVEIALSYGIPVHSDAVQAVGHVPVDFAATGLDALSISGHKLGAPVGVGALLLRRDLNPVPLLHGGGQERDVRSGTLDTAGILGLATAVDIAVRRQSHEARRLAALHDSLVRVVIDAVPDAVRNGDPEGLPTIANFSIPGCEGDSLLMLLDAYGIACSTGAACSAGVPEPSHVLLAMGISDPLVRGSLRFSLGHTSTEADVAAVANVIASVVERARNAGLVNRSA
jgi:cysteine desulfurase